MEDNKDILKEIFSSIQVDKAPDHLKTRIMEKVMKEPAYYLSEEKDNLFSFNIWLILISVFATTAVVLFFLDLAFLGTFIENMNLASVTGFFTSVYRGITDFFSALHFSLTSILIFAGAASLLFLDRILRKAFQINLFLI